jgi:hypothetical protein
MSRTKSQFILADPLLRIHSNWFKQTWVQLIFVFILIAFNLYLTSKSVKNKFLFTMTAYQKSKGLLQGQGGGIKHFKKYSTKHTLRQEGQHNTT